MAEIALSFAREHLLPLFMEVANMLRGVPKEVEDIKDELESIQALINDADKVTEAESEEDKSRDGITKRVKQLREASFCIEDIIDEYIMCEEKESHPGCAAIPCETVDFIKTLILRLQIAYKIQDVKSLVRGIRESSSGRDGMQSQCCLEQRPNSCKGNQNVTWQNLRMAPLYIEETEVVGFEGPRDELIDWLMKGRPERTVISVVGMGGLGKTTLVKNVFYHKEIIRHFDCHAWITVSQSYTVEGLLRDMLHKFYKEKMEVNPHNIAGMDRESLINEVRNYLWQKRYVVLFDDVWNAHFWDEIEFAVVDNKNGSRVLITTRKKDVAVSCRKSSFVQVHELQLLSEEKSLELFYKKAFRYDFDGYCPKQLVDTSFEIVKKCKGLPLAIVAIGGLLSSKDKVALEWEMFSQNLSSELERNSNLTGITKILGLSYDDLPYNLKSCLLYFGMYPEDCKVKSSRLIRQWIAEGFVKHERGKTLEEVAKQYLTELIRRSLVQISSFTIDGKVKGCRVHDLLYEIILRKFEDTGFCQCITEHDKSLPSGIIRRLTIATSSNDLMGSIESSHIRTILIITDKGLSEYILRRILTKYMMLKVLDFENARLYYVPESLGNLIYLKYLSFRNTWVQSLPKSIGKLQNLETLDVRQTRVLEMPREICKLRKLHHLLANIISSIQLKGSLGGMTSLLKIRLLEIDYDGMVIRELGNLKQLRDLRISNFREEHGSTLCSSVNEMQHLEKLYIYTANDEEVIDLHFISSLSTLRKLCLRGKLLKFPNWIPKLENLVKLSLKSSKLIDDPLKSLKDMPNLVFLSMSYHAYEGESLHFQNGGFQKLKELQLRYLYNLNSIFIDKGTLHSLEKLELTEIPQLKRVPFGIQHLEKLEVLNIQIMPTEFEQSITPNGGQDHWIIQHVSRVSIITWASEGHGGNNPHYSSLTEREIIKHPTLEIKGYGTASSLSDLALQYLN
ncbi:disease resistance protein RPM1-like [Abrus precatorius]|uniref:Disease resistance protein RPM1-like n=1 Tax=Abrus precatorius TaxID=3816 RepID=A0A8B8KBI1_ABRPR|nr:disease resistance protein RPM1-like [Abrus precatorius]